MFKFKSNSTSNSIHDVKLRLLKNFSVIALLSSFVVFMAFSARLVFQEDDQMEKHLQSFKQIAEKHYQLSLKKQAKLSEHVTAYYDENLLPDIVAEQLPVPMGKVSRFRDLIDAGYMLYYDQFSWQGKTVSYYLTIGGEAIEFGDENWDALLITSSLLMVFLLLVLRFTLKRVFDELVAPMTELSNQLSSNKTDQFSVSEPAIDEIKQLASKLNSYSEMKDRVAKQELMFAKYASHELKTPIAIISGAANLQAMNDDPIFQAKQRKRIVYAAEGMQKTVEVLLNMVKQENATQAYKLYAFSPEGIELSEFQNKAHQNVAVDLAMSDKIQLNMPPVVFNMVLKNIVENALRFTTQGRVKITVLENQIEVLDTGKGLSAQPETEHGLGLLIVRRIAKNYGWKFELINRSECSGCIARLLRT